MTRFCAGFLQRIFLSAAAYSFFSNFYAYAVTTSWNTNASGLFTAAANWDAGVPDFDDKAVFSRGTGVAYTVTFPGGSIFDPPPNYTIKDLLVRSNDVTFRDNSSPFITSPRLTVENPNVSIIVGPNAGDVAVLTTNLINLSGAQAFIGGYPNEAGEGTLNVAAGTFSMSGDLKIGGYGNGTMNVTAGGRVESQTGYVGYAGNGFDTSSHGIVNISGANSQWINSGQLYVGYYGTGELNVTAGGEVINAVGHSVIVGDFGHGTITIESGGRVSSYSVGLGNNLDTSGTVSVAGANSKWTNSGSFYVGLNSGQGTLRITDGGTVETVNLNVSPYGEVSGDGHIVGIVQNRGLVSPGASLGALNISGSYSQPILFEGDRSELLIELASASSFDQLLVSGNAALGGTLTVNLVDDFVPSIGQSFTILTADNVSGKFNTELPTVANRRFDVIYNARSVIVAVLPPLPGDYNQNGTVDAADYTIWRDTLGSTTDLRANGDNSGTSANVIDQADFVFWKTHFGVPTGSGSGGNANAAVPEPATIAMLLLGMLPMFPRRRAEVVAGMLARFTAGFAPR